MNLNFEYYKVFYYVCKCGSLTGAANVLMTSQPAVTRTIHNLESAIGCRLFIRSKKRRGTDAGRPDLLQIYFCRLRPDLQRGK